MKEQTEAQNGVLDRRTRDFVFGTSDRLNRMVLSLFDPKYKELEQLMQTPLDDVSIINERLDTIEELVENQDLYKKINNIMSAFDYDYGNFFKKLKGYPNFKEKGDYWKDGAMREIEVNLYAISNLKPLQKFTEGEISTKNIKDLTRSYERLRKSKPGNPGLDEFFEYVTKLNEKIKKMKKVDDSDKKDDDSEDDDETKTISYEDLFNILDIKKLSGFIPILEKAKLFHNKWYIYPKLAEIAIENKFTRPEVVPREENCLVIEDGYWPLLKDCIPNSTYLDKQHRVEIIEGVNSGAKTIDMKKRFILRLLL